MKYRTQDGLWQVEAITLSSAPEPSRAGDAPGSGSWVIIRHGGKTLIHCKLSELATELHAYGVELSDLIEDES